MNINGKIPREPKTKYPKEYPLKALTVGNDIRISGSLISVTIPEPLRNEVPPVFLLHSRGHRIIQ